MNPIRQLRMSIGLTQAEMASAARTSQPTVAAYESGTKSPTLRTLERLALAVEREAVVLFVTPMTREERRSLAIHDAIARRLAADPAPAMRRARTNVAKVLAANPGAAPLLNEWRALLRQPVVRVIDVLTDPRAHARELRQVTPFGGVLSASERADALARFRAIEDSA